MRTIYTVVGIDTPAIDVHISVDHIVKAKLEIGGLGRLLEKENTVISPDEKKILLEIAKRQKAATALGGATTNTLKNIVTSMGSKLINANFLACSGRDKRGIELRSMLRENEVSMIGPVRPGDTKTVFCLVDEKTGEQRYAELIGNSGELSIDDVKKKMGTVRRANIIYSTSYAIAQDNRLREATRFLYSSGIKPEISAFNLANLDVIEKMVREDPETLEEIISRSNTLIGNLGEASMFAFGETAGRGKEEKTATRIARKLMEQYTSLEYLVITFGNKGSLVSTRETQHIVPAYEAERVINQVGAGDLFAAKFLSQMLLSINNRNFAETSAYLAAWEVPAILRVAGTGIGEKRRADEIAVINLQEKRKELDMARGLQESNLPKEKPEVEGIEVATYWSPCKELGGDFYHYFCYENRFDFFIGDISGKGTPAAMRALTALAYLKELTKKPSDPAEIMTGLQSRLIKEPLFLIDDLGNVYLSSMYISFDVQRDMLSVSNAGHPDFYMLRDGELYIHPLGKGVRCPAFGLLKMEFEYKKAELALQEGDRIIFCSDGITDMQNPAGEFYGNSRLEESIKKHKGLSAERLKKAIVKDCRSFGKGKGQFDDMTVSVIDYKR
jgi:serine phosphatase RsbU (regulator of sigma subunit)/sugar/nucleoside kinase (ribokinase family)